MKRFFLLVFTLTLVFALAQTASAGEVLGDFDSDGKADYVVYRGGTFANPQSVWYILQSSNNLFRAVPWGQQGDYPL